jgi:hypothetical protein
MLLIDAIRPEARGQIYWTKVSVGTTVSARRLDSRVLGYRRASRLRYAQARCLILEIAMAVMTGLQSPTA